MRTVILASLVCSDGRARAGHDVPLVGAACALAALKPGRCLRVQGAPVQVDRRRDNDYETIAGTEWSTFHSKRALCAVRGHVYAKLRLVRAGVFPACAWGIGTRQRLGGVGRATLPWSSPKAGADVVRKCVPIGAPELGAGSGSGGRGSAQTTNETRPASSQTPAPVALCPNPSPECPCRRACSKDPWLPLNAPGRPRRSTPYPTRLDPQVVHFAVRCRAATRTSARRYGPCELA